ncbi:hypothetical protein O7635_01315 [Asanoa sp. WMMD1127]|uniref:hypothetical protein n=1 Tax=Asanoa sp. WMMD1127 TaxID=3016107 RepID=UPI002416EBD6|nr:hypothetical protein [Asanoa sp. WMMD1127]MDG4820490.1 hypothetical protein [Asanoa sp. WMMD1127]
MTSRAEQPEDLPLPATGVRPKEPAGPGARQTSPSTLTGTVTTGVEPNCLLIDGFLLVGGDRAVIRAGARLTVTGRVDPGVRSTCQQGVPFVVSRAVPA